MAFGWDDAIGLGVQATGNVIGEVQAGDDEAAKRAILRRIIEQYENLPEPELEAIQAELLGPSQAGQVRGDPAMREAQLNVLNKLRGIEDAGGMTLEDRAAYNQTLGQAARQESAGRAQIRNQMQARGVANSGADLAMQLQNQQASAERANQAGLDMAGQAQKRYLQSILGRGQAAGQMRGQDFGEQMQAAQARDAFAKYNADAMNRANYYNKAERPNQMYKNSLSRLEGMTGGQTNQAKSYAADAQNTRNSWGSLGVAAREAVKEFGKPSGTAKSPDEEDENTNPVWRFDGT